MRQQSYYYLNNKKYVTLASNLDSLLTEINTFYETSTKRKIVFVVGDDVSLLEGGVIDAMKAVVLKHSPLTTDDTIDGLFEVKEFSEIDNLNYLNNDEKVFLAFFNEFQMVNVYKKYSKALLKSLDNEALVNDFLAKVFARDLLVGFDKGSVFSKAVEDSKEYEESYDDYPNFPGSKLWSYDMLFFCNDNFSNDKVLAMLKEKFSIHGAKNINEQMSTLVTKVSYISPLIGILDYLEKNHSYDKDSFITTVWQQDNYSLALYTLRDLWNTMESTEGFIEKLQNHSNWDYYETYREYKNTIPMMIDIHEQGYNNANVDSIREYWDEVEFLHKRKSRIPYLMHSVQPL
ncbi:MAG: hypothetical protein NZ824_05080 [Candidatus Thioglobus sp.]|nr:hypothetical protein [Candidatus Thioglobus sp.]